jgi:hypothetical protein
MENTNRIYQVSLFDVVFMTDNGLESKHTRLVHIYIFCDLLC